MLKKSRTLVNHFAWSSFPSWIQQWQFVSAKHIERERLWYILFVIQESGKYPMAIFRRSLQRIRDMFTKLIFLLLIALHFVDSCCPNRSIQNIDKEQKTFIKKALKNNRSDGTRLLRRFCSRPPQQNRCCRIFYVLCSIRWEQRGDDDDDLMATW